MFSQIELRREASIHSNVLRLRLQKQKLVSTPSPTAAASQGDGGIGSIYNADRKNISSP